MQIILTDLEKQLIKLYKKEDFEAIIKLMLEDEEYEKLFRDIYFYHNPIILFLTMFMTFTYHKDEILRNCSFYMFNYFMNVIEMENKNA